MMPLTDPAYDKAVASSDSEPPIRADMQGADRGMSPWFPDQPGLSRLWVAS